MRGLHDKLEDASVAERREILVQHLGARPLLLVEWKQLLRDAGCVDLHVEDWSDYSGPFRPVVIGPFHDLARMHARTINRAAKKLLECNHPMAIIEVHAAEDLMWQVAQVGMNMSRVDSFAGSTSRRSSLCWALYMTPCLDS